MILCPTRICPTVQQGSQTKRGGRIGLSGHTDKPGNTLRTHADRHGAFRCGKFGQACFSRRIFTFDAFTGVSCCG